MCFVPNSYNESPEAVVVTFREESMMAMFACFQTGANERTLLIEDQRVVILST